MAHAIPGREVRDLGDALVLLDARDPDPFWNRMVSVRWPPEPGAFDRRLNEALTLFALAARQPHVWPSPCHNAPPDLVARLQAIGFRDVGGGHVMVLADAAACLPVDPSELRGGIEVRAIRCAADAAAADVDDVAFVLAESFGAAPGRETELAADLRATLDDARITLVLVRSDGEPAAVAKSTAFGGLTYLSSIGTRRAFRGRGLAAIATRHAVAEAGADGGLAVSRRLQRQHRRDPALRAPGLRLDRRGTRPAPRVRSRRP